MVLYSILDLKIHLQNVYNNANKTIALLRKLHNTLPSASLITIYKTPSRLWGYNLWLSSQWVLSSKNSIISIQRIISYNWRHNENREGENVLQIRTWISLTRRLHRKLCCFIKLFKNGNKRVTLLHKSFLMNFENSYFKSLFKRNTWLFCFYLNFWWFHNS